MTSLIYELNGDINEFDGDYYGIPVFRKMTNSRIEISICKKLQVLDNKHIVQIYRVADNYIDMEILQPIRNYQENIDIINDTAFYVKSFLQNNGIAYIDWKLDNIGLSNNKYKLFDFDMSGTFNCITKEWIIKPFQDSYNYKKCTELKITNSIEIDNYSYINFSYF